MYSRQARGTLWWKALTQYEKSGAFRAIKRAVNGGTRYRVGRDTSAQVNLCLLRFERAFTVATSGTLRFGVTYEACVRSGGVGQLCRALRGHPGRVSRSQHVTGPRMAILRAVLVGVFQCRHSRAAAASSTVLPALLQAAQPQVVPMKHTFAKGSWRHGPQLSETLREDYRWLRTTPPSAEWRFHVVGYAGSWPLLDDLPEKPPLSLAARYHAWYGRRLRCPL